MTNKDLIRSQLEYIAKADGVMFLNQLDMVRARDFAAQEKKNMPSNIQLSNVMATVRGNGIQLPTEEEISQKLTVVRGEVATLDLEQKIKVLIFGAMRSGKGFEEAVELEKSKKFDVTFVGKPQDPNLLASIADAKEICRDRGGMVGLEVAAITRYRVKEVAKCIAQKLSKECTKAGISLENAEKELFEIFCKQEVSGALGVFDVVGSFVRGLGKDISDSPCYERHKSKIKGVEDGDVGPDYIRDQISYYIEEECRDQRVKKVIIEKFKKEINEGVSDYTKRLKISDVGGFSQGISDVGIQKERADAIKRMPKYLPVANWVIQNRDVISESERFTTEQAEIIKKILGLSECECKLLKIAEYMGQNCGMTDKRSEMLKHLEEYACWDGLIKKASAVPEDYRKDISSKMNDTSMTAAQKLECMKEILEEKKDECEKKGVYLDVDAAKLDEVARQHLYCVKLEFSKEFANNSSSIINAQSRFLFVFSYKGDLTSEEFTRGKYAGSMRLLENKGRKDSSYIQDISCAINGHEAKDICDALGKAGMAVKEPFSSQKVAEHHITMYRVDRR